MQNNVSPTHPKVAEPENLGAAVEEDTAGHLKALADGVPQGAAPDGIMSRLDEGDEDTEGHGRRFGTELRATGDEETEGFMALADGAEDTEGHVRLAAAPGDEPEGFRSLRVQEVKGNADEESRF